MQNFDVFNGDADGICALIQIHHKRQRQGFTDDPQLITGVKRDNALLSQIPSHIFAAQITVLDISLDKNRDDLNTLLGRGNRIFYADHHYPGEIPEHPLLSTHIDPQSETCTSLILNQLVAEADFQWALVGAYGDNLIKTAHHYAEQKGLKASTRSDLLKLGTLVNYNGYGAELDDLHFHPEHLYLALREFENPSDFILDSNSGYQKLLDGYEQDLQHAMETPIHYENNDISVLVFPNETWARRVNGVFNNQLANQDADKAHGILTPLKDGSGYQVGVRAPLNNRVGADELCRQFATGGGRQGAAGINKLASAQVDDFIERFAKQYQG